MEDRPISIFDRIRRLLRIKDRQAGDLVDVFGDEEPVHDKGPLLEQLEELTGSTFVYSERLGTPGRMEGVSDVALGFLLVIDDEIDDRFRPALLEVLPEVARAADDRESQQAEVAVEAVCRELSAAVLTAVGWFSDDETRSFETVRSLDEVAAQIKEMFERIEEILADTGNTAEHDFARQRLVGAGRVLAGAAAAVEQVDAPFRCMVGVRTALSQAARIIDADCFADITIRALRRITDA